MSVPAPPRLIRATTSSHAPAPRRQLRICLIASSRFPLCEPFAGGMESHTHLLARRLGERGHSVAVFAAPGSDPALGAEELSVPRFTGSAKGRADIGALPQEWTQEHHAYLGLMLSLAGRRRDDFDIVHNNSLHHLPVAMSGALRVPVLTTLHTPPTSWLESAASFASPKALFVAVSEATAQSWRPLLDPVTVRNGVDTDAWAYGHGGQRAVWTGRIASEKAPHLAIRAASAAGLEIDLAGPIMDRDYFCSVVEPLLSHRARYHGHLSQAGLQRLVSSSLVAVVSPIWDEPYGLVAAEAMSCGTPVAAFARGGLKEIIVPGAGRLAAPYEPAALADAMREAAELPRQGVRQHAMRECSADRMVAGYESAYGSALRAYEGAQP